ncbi:RhoGAP domain containing protein [Acanthamoeba castellanii str. Neff]|uniref:RhoGAP domain containing protein n=1 Tax=Acanthamoeba castellanii (strain ATCC 30010 / Neff) TaxID=1257118 RepID=L8HEL6_ACACF|nr:RhoGAP domain containing protein [Acanthamoeba castellanii str. Neff]ELR23213.1 RhoGAP domain containing protein [Acanthamoeba castellanii str. Neff]
MMKERKGSTLGGRPGDSSVIVPRSPRVAPQSGDNERTPPPLGLLGKVASIRNLSRKKKLQEATKTKTADTPTTLRPKKAKDPADDPLGEDWHTAPLPPPLSGGVLYISQELSTVTSPPIPPSPRSAGSLGAAAAARHPRGFFDRHSLSVLPVSPNFVCPPPATPITSSPSPLPKDVRGDIAKFQLEGYARKYFKTRKKGIFKRQVPIKDLLTFQKKDMDSPLLDLKNKPELHSIAIKIELLQEALREGQIRDEVYCQICKQTCDTPSAEILYKGWELMTFCCVTFPPTRNFEEWLRKHLWEHTKLSDSRQASYARFCVRKLDLICEAPPSARVPSYHEIEMMKEIMDWQKEKGIGLEVPQIMVHLCEGVLRLNGHSALGIFRVKGDTKRTNDLKAELECNRYTLDTLNPHDLANLLKTWLRELPDPLIPFELQPKCLAVADTVQPTLQVVNTKLHPLNKKALLYLVEFLRTFLAPEVEGRTKMNLANLATIFGPNLLRAPDAEVSLENAQLAQDFVNTLLKHWRG